MERWFSCSARSLFQVQTRKDPDNISGPNVCFYMRQISVRPGPALCPQVPFIQSTISLEAGMSGDWVHEQGYSRLSHVRCQCFSRSHRRKVKHWLSVATCLKTWKRRQEKKKQNKTPTTKTFKTSVHDPENRQISKAVYISLTLVLRVRIKLIYILSLTLLFYLTEKTQL